MAHKSALGKGLASLLPSASAGVDKKEEAFIVSHELIKSSETSKQKESEDLEKGGLSRDRYLGISMIGIDAIQVNPYQPRRDFDEDSLEELAQSIRTNGLIQPLVVRKSKTGFELIAGERRLRAAQKVGLKQVPIVIRKTTDREALELALVENIQREDLNCIDEAMAYFQLIQEFALTQEAVAERVGKDRASVANHLRLLKLPEVIREDLKQQLLSFGHGKALLSIEDPELRLRAHALVVEKHLSVRETEALVEAMKVRPSVNLKENPTEPTPVGRRLSHLSRELEQLWSTKVEIKGSERCGKVILHYHSSSDLERLLELMQRPTVVKKSDASVRPL